MTVEKIKSKLKRIPTSTFLTLLLYTVLITATVIAALKLARKDPLNCVILGILALSELHLAIMTVVKALRVIARESVSLTYLKENGLLEAAVSGHDHPAVRKFAANELACDDDTPIGRFAFELNSRLVWHDLSADESEFYVVEAEEMTAEKLRNMLVKFPTPAIISLLLYPMLIAITVYCAILLADDMFLVFILGLLVCVELFLAVKTVFRMLTVRKNGIRTLRYLEEKGLLEVAAAEYNHPGKVVFHAPARDYIPDKFLYRGNTLTKNFIFALGSNQIIRYQDAAGTYMHKHERHLNHRFASSYNSVFTVVTAENEELDLISYQFLSGTTPPTDFIDWLCDIIKAKNPRCSIPKTEQLNI